MPVLSPCTDIKSLIEQHAGIQVVGKPNYVHGVQEYHSNCPFCPDSTDGFITCPETGRYSHAIRSKGCGRTGDMIDFLQEYAGMTRWEACEEIGLDSDEIGFMRSEPDLSALARKYSSPGKVWRDCADNEVALAQARMRRPVGSIGLEFLRARGFSDEIIQERNLGYLPLSNGKYLHQEPLEKWGLTYEEVGKEHVNVFEGVLIPWYVNHQTWKLEVRRITQADPDHRTPEISGSREPLYNCDAIQSGKPVVLCEGAFDAISGIQACGDDRAVFVATGGTGKARVNTWIKRLSEASCVLVAFDDDESGKKGSDYWCDVLPNAIRCVPWSHDLNDMLRDKPDGNDIREWLTDGIETYNLIEKAKKVPAKSVQPVVTSSVQSREHGHYENVSPAQPSNPLQGKEPYQPKPWPDLSLQQIIDIAKNMQHTGITFSVIEGELHVDCDFDLSFNMRRFINNCRGALIDWLKCPGYSQALKFYQSLCARSGYYLRLSASDQIAIGVPETVSDEMYARISRQVKSHGEAMYAVLNDMPDASVQVLATIGVA